jgi:hypothetical protein
MLVFVFLCCVVLCRQRPLRRADHSSKGVLPSVLVRLRNLRCEAAKVLTETVDPLMMMNHQVNRIWRYETEVARSGSHKTDRSMTLEVTGHILEYHM